MRVTPTNLDGPLLIEPVVHGDDRGFFIESFREDVLEAAGWTGGFVQDNHSRSRHGIARGMHFQSGQAKLVRCVRGAIFDVVVDIRRESPGFGRWEGFQLDDEAHCQLLIPDGFAHGFCVLSDIADVTYKVSTYYDASRESGFRFDDPDVAIAWPLAPGSMHVSERDRNAPVLSVLADGGGLGPAGR